jgi:uncharacterized Zn finger protein (UPF0148 family)
MTEKRLGQYMLQGWALMGETCPSGCPCPLVFRKATGIYKCVACDQEFDSLSKPAPLATASAPAPVVAAEWQKEVVGNLQQRLMQDARRLGEINDQDVLKKLLENMKSLTSLLETIPRL